MLKYKKSLLLFSLLALFVDVYAQPINSSSQETSDFMNSNGKIFVVVAVVLVILIGLFIYLINLDRKIKKLEGDQAINK